MKVDKAYLSRIRERLERKKSNGDISQNLVNATPASVRDECLHVCEANFNTGDMGVLQSFFGHREDKKAYLNAIEQFKIGRLKSMANFLNDMSIDTRQKNVELLAWLIDFQPRPYNPKYDYTQNKPKPIQGKIPSVIKKFKALRFILPPAILIVIATIYFLTLERKCMYWAGDHYESVSCKRIFGPDTLVIAMDLQLLYKFKKIKDWSTISKRSIGKVWYVKRYDSIEFYTAGGFHPIDTQYRLKPLTTYIFDHYLTGKN